MKRFQDKDYDIYAKPPDSRDKILTNEIPHTESRTVAGERMTLEAIEYIKLPQDSSGSEYTYTHRYSTKR